MIENRVLKAAEEHMDLAAIYERAGNTDAAMRLRAVSNLLYAISQGDDWQTILPKPTKEDLEKLNGFRLKKKLYANRIREILKKAKDQPCADCGVNYGPEQTFDHRDRNSKKFSLANCASKNITLKQLNEEIAKCDVVCRPCHTKREQERDKNA